VLHCPRCALASYKINVDICKSIKKDEDICEKSCIIPALYLDLIASNTKDMKNGKEYIWIINYILGYILEACISI